MEFDKEKLFATLKRTNPNLVVTERQWDQETRAKLLALLKRQNEKYSHAPVLGSGALQQGK